MALQLKRKEITRVRPLAGGIFGWRDKGYRLVPFYSHAKATASATTANA